MLIIALITLIIEFDQLSAFLLSFATMMDTAKLTSMLIGGCVALVVLAIAGYWLFHRLEGRFRVVLTQLIEGLLSLRKVKNIQGVYPLHHFYLDHLFFHGICYIILHSRDKWFGLAGWPDAFGFRGYSHVNPGAGWFWHLPHYYQQHAPTL